MVHSRKEVISDVPNSFYNSFRPLLSNVGEATSSPRVNALSPINDHYFSFVPAATLCKRGVDRSAFKLSNSQLPYDIRRFPQYVLRL